MTSSHDAKEVEWDELEVEITKWPQMEPAMAVIAKAMTMTVSKTPANAHRPMFTGHRAPACGRRELTKK